MQVTLTKRREYKNGGASYELAGVRGGVYFSPKMIPGEKPATIELTTENFASAVDTSAADAKKADRLAKAEAKKAEREAKKQARADAKAAKAAAKLTAANVPTPPDAPQV